MEKICTLVVGFMILSCALNLSAQQSNTNDAWQRYNAEKKSEIAAVLLEEIPLLGHAYAGDIKRGYVPAAVSGGGIAIYIVGAAADNGYIAVLGGLIYAGSRIWGMISAYNTAKDYNSNLKNKLNLSLQPINDPFRGTMGYSVALTVNF